MVTQVCDTIFKEKIPVRGDEGGFKINQIILVMVGGGGGGFLDKFLFWGRRRSSEFLVGGWDVKELFRLSIPRYFLMG